MSDREAGPVGRDGAPHFAAAPESRWLALEEAARLVERHCYSHGQRPVSWCEYCGIAGDIRALATAEPARTERQAGPPKENP
jgi:hypothetical protein